MKYLYIYLLIINAAGFLLMLIDKQKARKKKWRISEAALMAAAVMGGSAGSLLGMHIFHHKTKHPKFRIGIPVILTLQVIIVICLLQ